MNPETTATPANRGLFEALRDRLAQRPDTEHEAALIRIVFAVLGSCYLAIALRTGMVADAGRIHAVAIIAFILAYSIVTLIAILLKPQISVSRRIAWIVIDNSAVTYTLFFLGEVAIPFFGIYLFNICGNGFRFGQRYLYMASAVSITGFMLVLTISEYWLTRRVLGIGLLTILIIIPIYFASLVRQLHAALAHMRNMATHDALTGLPNRHSFYEHLHHAIRLAEQNNTPFAVVFVDLDGFKPINDALGHAVGDAVLKSVARRLEQSVRKHDIISRYGGDEFVIILTGIHKNEVSSVAHKIINAIAMPYETDGKTVSLTSSVGIATYPDSGHTVDGLVAHADAAMYQSKREGKNSFCIDGELCFAEIPEILVGEYGTRLTGQR
jgi:diguanylate cyclase (GGDEF)-like protein